MSEMSLDEKSKTEIKGLVVLRRNFYSIFLPAVSAHTTTIKDWQML
jgi:hypothetical protein